MISLRWASTRQQEPFDPTYRFATSWLLTPFALVIYRALVSLYAFVTLFFAIIYQLAQDHLDHHAGQSFSYFTNLTYWGIAFYFAFSAAHTASYALRGTPLLARWPRVLQTLHSIYYTTIVTLPLLVTIVYWAILHDGTFSSRFNAWEDVSKHAFNGVFAFLEILLPRTAPPPFLHLIPLVLILALYLALAFVTYADQGFYTYGFLDNRTAGPGRVAAYAFGILAAAVVIFIVVHFLIRLRMWVTESKLGMTGKFSPREERHRGLRSEPEAPAHVYPDMADAPPIPPKSAGRASRMNSPSGHKAAV